MWSILLYVAHTVVYSLTAHYTKEDNEVKEEGLKEQELSCRNMYKPCHPEQKNIYWNERRNPTDDKRYTEA